MPYCKLTESKDLSGSHDATIYRFYFNFIPEDKIGEPEEKSYILEYIITVNCSRTLIRMFNINDIDIEKVLYWVARRSLEKNHSSKEIQITLNSRSYPKGFPFDPSLIKYPNPEGFFVDSINKWGYPVDSPSPYM